MNSIVIGIAATVLILSTVISFIALLKRNFKECTSSALYILIISDMLSCVLIVLLLIYNYYKEIKSQSAGVPSGNGIMTFFKIIDETIDEKYETADCDLQVILLNYALFLIPFANSFVSLLSMSIQYNFEVDTLYKKCTSWMNLDVSKERQKNLLTNRNKRNKTITIMTVAGQWIIPILSSITLLFADHKILTDEREADMTCSLTTNFPFDNCYFVPSDHSLESSNSTGYLPTNQNNYINALELDRVQSNSSESDEIVSKVYDVIESALESSSMELHTSEEHYNTTQLLNVTSFMKIPHKQNEKNDDKLFEDLMSNVSTQYMTDAFTESLLFMTTEESPELSLKKSGNITTDEDILKSIVQKIYNSRPRFPKRGRMHMNTLIDQKILMLDSTVKFMTPTCLKSQCFVSTNFLKIHLFLLMIFIYFGPILLSTILHMRFHYVWANVCDELNISERILSSSGSSNEPHSASSQSLSNFKGFTSKHDNIEEGGSSKGEVQGEKAVAEDGESFQSAKQQTEEMGKQSRILKTSLIAGIVLWSPMFLEVLMKVFLCSDLPMWVIHLFYLAAISYGAVRNYLNLRLLSSSEIVNNVFRKTNIVYPTAGAPGCVVPG